MSLQSSPYIHYPNITTYSHECSLYLAPSSIPNAGFGVFTTKAIPARSPVQPYPDAPSIPVLDPDTHCERSLSKKHLRHWAHIEYFWSGDGHIGFEAMASEDNVMTMGSLSNYHPYLYNVKPMGFGYDDSFNHTLIRNSTYQSPQLGAFSYYQGQVFVAIQVGTETDTQSNRNHKNPLFLKKENTCVLIWSRLIVRTVGYSSWRRDICRLWRGLVGYTSQYVCRFHSSKR